MSASNQLAAYLPLILAVLLVGGAILGSRLQPLQRRMVQRFIVLPLLGVTVAGIIWMAAGRHDYERAGILLFMVLLTLPRLVSRRAQEVAR